MNTIKALWDFSNEINVGDIIISKQGEVNAKLWHSNIRLYF